jgi:hypothetical protein
MRAIVIGAVLLGASPVLAQYTPPTNCQTLPGGRIVCDNGRGGTFGASPMPGGGYLMDDGTRTRPLPGGGYQIEPPQPIPQPGRPTCLKDSFGRCM